jgi:hypothetical protein
LNLALFKYALAALQPVNTQWVSDFRKKLIRVAGEGERFDLLTLRLIQQGEWIG